MPQSTGSWSGVGAAHPSWGVGAGGVQPSQWGGLAQATRGQFPGETRNLNPRDNVNVRFLGTTDGRGTFYRAAEWMGRSCLSEGLSNRRSEFRRSLSGCGAPSQSGFPLIGRTGPQGGCHHLHHIGRPGDLEGMSCSRPRGRVGGNRTPDFRSGPPTLPPKRLGHHSHLSHFLSLTSAGFRKMGQLVSHDCKGP